MNCKRTEEID